MRITASEIEKMFVAQAAATPIGGRFDFQGIADRLNEWMDRKLFALPGESTAVGHGGAVGVDGRRTRPPELAVVGTCRICGCTETSACMIAMGLGFYRPCGWVNDERTLCNNPDCVATAAVPAEPRLPAA